MDQAAADSKAGPAAAEAQFKQIFTTSFKSLHYYAYSILKDEMAAEEMVQNVFCRLWEKKDEIQIHKATQAYLYRSVYNECVNYLKHLKVRARYHASHINSEQFAESSEGRLENKALEQQAQQALNELPEQCRTIFQMSRMEQMKYREIADRLDISIKTVETQMSKALKILRVRLAEYLPLIVLSIATFKN
jgi:RNA polymerase sigma-70 factor (ECF subfamily)